MNLFWRCTHSWPGCGDEPAKYIVECEIKPSPAAVIDTCSIEFDEATDTLEIEEFTIPYIEEA